MGKPSAERKAVQRAREAQQGIGKLEIHLSVREREILRRNCALRRPGREPYGADEYVELLILQDGERLERELKALHNRRCGKCGDKLPVTECCHDGDSQCWVTLGWHETKLKTNVS